MVFYMKVIKLLKSSISIFVLLGSLSSFIFSGKFSSESFIERCADYTAQVVRNNTTNRSYCAISVTQTESSGPTLDPYAEFHRLYGIFKQESATFGSMFNFHKTESVSLNEFDTSVNQSMFYLGPVGTIKYKGHYKTYVYPFEVMFEDERMYDISRYVVYVSQSQANSILKTRGIIKEEYSLEDYKSLLKTLTPITINDVTADFVINNIFYETNYYFDCFKEIVGDFVLISYFLPFKEYIKSNIYLLNEHKFQNEYFMKYLNNAYSNKKYDVKVCERNIKGAVDLDLITNFYYGSSNQKEWAVSLLIVIGVIMTLLNFALVWFSKNQITKKMPFLLVEFIASLIPYLIFKAVYKATKNIYFFSTFGLRLNFIFIMVLIVANAVAYFVYKRIKHKKDKYLKMQDCYEEFNI